MELSTNSLEMKVSPIEIYKKDSSEGAKCPFITKARVQRVALASLAALGLAGYVGALVLIANPSIAIPVGFVCAGIYGVSFISSAMIKDYDNPREVAEMRQKAVSMNYDSLLRAHGGRGFVKRILDSRLLSSKELLEKVDREMKVQTAFMQQKYDEIGSPLFTAIAEVKQSYKKIEMLERHRSEILAWQRDLEQKIYQLEKRWV